MSLKFKGYQVDGKDVETFDLKYNGKIITLNKGDVVDVRDFGVETKHVDGVESSMLKKYPTFGLERVKTSAKDYAGDKVLIEKLDKAEKAVEAANKAIDELKADNDELTKENSGLKAQINGFAKEKESLQERINSLEAQLKAEQYPEKKKK